MSKFTALLIKFSFNWAVCYGPVIAVRNYLEHQVSLSDIYCWMQNCLIYMSAKPQGY